jgi:triphosphoribosyl-dephospho-CoA synthetase
MSKARQSLGKRMRQAVYKSSEWRRLAARKGIQTIPVLSAEKLANNSVYGKLGVSIERIQGL